MIFSTDKQRQGQEELRVRRLLIRYAKKGLLTANMVEKIEQEKKLPVFIRDGLRKKHIYTSMETVLKVIKTIPPSFFTTSVKRDLLFSCRLDFVRYLPDFLLRQKSIFHTTVTELAEKDIPAFEKLQEKFFKYSSSHPLRPEDGFLQKLIKSKQGVIFGIKDKDALVAGCALSFADIQEEEIRRYFSIPKHYEHFARVQKMATLPSYEYLKVDLLKQVIDTCTSREINVLYCYVDKNKEFIREFFSEAGKEFKPIADRQISPEITLLAFDLTSSNETK